MTEYKSFPTPLEFGDTRLTVLEWRETTSNGMDGRSWRVREVGGSGYSFHLKLSGSVCGTMNLGGACEDVTEELIAPVLAFSIQGEIAARGELPSRGEDLVVWVRADDFRAIGMGPPG